MSDYFDFSLFIDAEVNNIESWYLERFQTLLELAKKDENNYYHRFTKFSKDEALSLAQKTWRDIYLLNLENYIEPTRSRADLIFANVFTSKIYLTMSLYVILGPLASFFYFFKWMKSIL